MHLLCKKSYTSNINIFVTLRIESNRHNEMCLYDSVIKFIFMLIGVDVQKTDKYLWTISIRWFALKFYKAMMIIFRNIRKKR